MVPGFNSRVVCGDVEYHVQTEDLGQARPTVLTLVYRGGAIVLREKFEYGDILGANPQAAQVKTLMEAQHRRIMRRVEAGLTAADAPRPGPVIRHARARYAPDRRRPVGRRPWMT